MSECHSCRDWRKCSSYKIWFNYAEIRFCWYQCIFILQNAETLKGGSWPQDPDNPNDNNSSRTNVKTEASFVKPELIIGEIEARLKTVDNKGELLITQIEDGRTFENLSSGARLILRYISGVTRKKMGFRAWKRQRNYRRNDYKNASKCRA